MTNNNTREPYYVPHVTPEERRFRTVSVSEGNALGALHGLEARSAAHELVRHAADQVGRPMHGLQQKALSEAPNPITDLTAFRDFQTSRANDAVDAAQNPNLDFNQSAALVADNGEFSTDHNDPGMKTDLVDPLAIDPFGHLAYINGLTASFKERDDLAEAV